MTRPIHTEADLVDAFVAMPERNAVDAAVVREFETLAGIPDLVFVETSPRGVDLRAELEASGAPTNGHANVMTCLSRRRPHTIDYIVSRSGLGYGYVRRIVSDLKQAGLAEVTNTGSVILAASYCPPRIRFTAIEFKLSDWRRALSQAVRHQSFADKTLVIMPMSRENSLRQAASTFRDYGVGSAVFDPGSCRVKYIVRPRPRRRVSERIYLDAVGRATAAVLTA